MRIQKPGRVEGEGSQWKEASEEETDNVSEQSSPARSLLLCILDSDLMHASRASGATRPDMPLGTTHETGKWIC